mgnify:CR=1 FL=1
MINCLDDSLYQIEKEGLTYSEKEKKYNISLDPNVYDNLMK